MGHTEPFKVTDATRLEVTLTRGQWRAIRDEIGRAWSGPLQPLYDQLATWDLDPTDLDPTDDDRAEDPRR